MTRALCVLTVMGLTACQEAPPPAVDAPPEVTAKKSAAKPSKPPPAAPAKPVAQPAKAAPAIAPKPARTPAKALTTGQTRKANKVHWDGPVQWHDWARGQAKAKAENKPICLVVYADWCPRCRELAPVFADEKIVALADKMVMVHQNADARPAWLDDLKVFGTYVPRVFFFTADGTLREEVTSTHPRYPYFYTPRSVDALAASMKAAIDG